MIQPMSVAKSTRSPAPQVGLVRGLTRDREQEAALDVEGALGTPGRARGVGQEIRSLALDLDRSESPGFPRHDVLPPHVASRLHRAVDTGPPPHEDVLDVRRVSKSVVEDLLHRDEPAAAVRRVGGQDDLRTGVGETGGDGRAGEP